MPQRTNQFQHLLKLIHEAFASAGANITESALVLAPGLGELREIDILIETDVAPYKIKVAVEAKDHGRKLNVTDIESIASKYYGAGNVPVNKVVVVSRNGCSRQAARKAALIGIEVRQLSVTKVADWKALLPFADGQKLVLKSLPHIADVVFNPPPPATPCPFHQGLIVNKETGREIDPPMQYVKKAMRSFMLQRDFLRITEPARRAADSVAMKFDMGRFVLRVAGTDHDLRSISFRMYWADKSAPLAFESYDFTGEGQSSATVKHAVAEFDGCRVEILLPEGLSSQNAIVEFTHTGTQPASTSAKLLLGTKPGDGSKVG